jgi:hypothetical protein
MILIWRCQNILTEQGLKHMWNLEPQSFCEVWGHSRFIDLPGIELYLSIYQSISFCISYIQVAAHVSRIH